MRRPIHARAGYTLIEVMISALLSAMVIGAATMFAHKETRLLSVTSNAIDMTDSSRSVIDALADDLRHAGAGVGYRTDGTFGGLLAGAYSIDGVSFNSNNSRINLTTASNVPTDDIAITLADGARSTIASYSFAGSGQVCSGAGFNVGELAVLRSEDGLAARTVRIDSLTPSTCSQGQCVGGCDNFSWSTRTGFESDTSAALASYLGGEIAGGLKTIVWFVEATEPARPTLRRAVFDGRGTTCSGRNNNCGTLMSEYVETVQMQIWRWDTTSNAWRNISAGPLNVRDRLRVDVEVVVRSSTDGDRLTTPVQLRLESGQCAPNCTLRDRYERRVLRTSVDIRNSSRMRLR